MTRSPRLQLGTWLPGLREKLRLDSKRRFLFLLIFFNGLLVVILLLTVRNQEIRRRILRIEETIVVQVTRLAERERFATQVAYITATPPVTVISRITSTHTATAPPAQATSTPTRTPRPETPKPARRATNTLVPRPTWTLMPTPTIPPPPTDTPAPTHTPTPTLTPTPASIVSSIGLSASSRHITANGQATSQISAQLFDQHGNPFLDQVAVTFSTNRGGFWGARSVVVLADNGLAEATLTSSTSVGTATVHVQAEGASASIDVTFGPGPPHTLDLTATPERPDVQQVSTLEAVVQDAFGNRVADGTVVRFEATFGTLASQEQATSGGIARATLSSNAPGQATVTARSGGVAGTVIVEFVSAISLTRVEPNSGCNSAPVDITIVGSGFSLGATATLGAWALNTTWVSASTLHATVPQDIAAGVYDLTVSTSGSDFASLPGGYTAQNCGSLDTTLDSGYLGTYGAEPDFAPGQGDDDQIQVLFLEVPEGTPGPLYVRVLDPDCGGVLDVQNGGAWDTTFEFTVYGGSGAYTVPDARNSHPIDGVYSGMALATAVLGEDPSSDGQWYELGPFNVADGELVRGKRVFKLAVVGKPPESPGINFADLNVYNIALSTSSGSNSAPAGARILAFSWTFLIPGDAYQTPPRLFPHVGPGVAALVQHNWDYDRSAQNAGLTAITPARTLDIPYDRVSGDNEGRNSSHQVLDIERNTTWAISCWAQTGQALADNLVTFWATDQGGRALPLFARSTKSPPP
jgi:hypothetical protein